MHEQFIRAQDGTKIFVKTYGNPFATKRTPVLCLSGLVRTSRDYDEFAPALEAQGFFVVSIDYRGRGRSDFAPAETYRAQTIIGDVIAVMNALHIEQPLVIGTSFGGILGMAMSALFPNRIKGLVMNDVGPAFGTEGVGRIREYVGKDHPQKSWEEATLHIKGMFPNLRFANEEGWLSMAKGTFKEGDDGLLHVQWDTHIAKTMGIRPTDPDLWKLWGALKHKPVLAIRGSVSDVLTQDTFDKMAETKPDLVRAIVDGVGHCPLFSEPAVQEKLIPFLNRF